jgi:hypothetical protein
MYKLGCLLGEWHFKLPMASAILTILYPNEFTVYDQRVCDVLDAFHNLSSLNFEKLWLGYEEFKRKVEETTPQEFILRDKDRYLWGKSFYQQLTRDIEHRFKDQDEQI